MHKDQKFSVRLQPQLGEIAIEASQIISRLEQVAEGNLKDAAYNQPTVFLGIDQRRSDDIIQIVQGLINTDEDGEPNSFPALDDVAKLVLVAHSLAAYCGNVDRQISQKLNARFTADATRWLSHLFGLVNVAVCLSVDNN